MSFADVDVPVSGGRHGEVRIGTLRSLGRVAAFKRPLVAPHEGSGAAVRAFRHEMAVNAALGAHANLTAALGGILDDGGGGGDDVPVLALEFLPMGSVQGALQRRARSGGGVAAGDCGGMSAWDEATAHVARQARTRPALLNSHGTVSLAAELEAAGGALASAAAAALSGPAPGGRLSVLRDAAAGLGAVHAAGFVHRDVHTGEGGGGR